MMIRQVLSQVLIHGGVGPVEGSSILVDVENVVLNQITALLLSSV